MLWRAPLVPLVTIFTQFLLHITEVQLGMFETRESFARQVGNSQRMLWTGVALAGVAFSIMASARFWGAKAIGRTWWKPMSIAWGTLLTGTVLCLALGLPLFWLAAILSGAVGAVIQWVAFVTVLPPIIMIVAGLARDHRVTIRSAYEKEWYTALRVVILVSFAIVPFFVLHSYNHMLALGRGHLPLLFILLWDSLVMGVLASAAGTALTYGFLGRRLARGFRIRWNERRGRFTR